MKLLHNEDVTTAPSVEADLPTLMSWHFPRTALAATVRNAMLSGPQEPVTIFSPRRRGKSTFLLHDLAPAFMSDHAVVWVDCWAARGDVLAGALEKLHMAEFDIRNGRNPLYKAMSSAVSSIEAFGIKVDLSGDAEPALPQNHFLHLNRLIARLHRLTNRKVVLMFDEIQAVVRDPKGPEFCAALRAALTENSENVRVIFTGSSQAALSSLFASTGSPLYEYSSHLDFPNLDKKFTDFLADKFQKDTGMSLSKDNLFFAFKEMSYMPRPMIDMLVAMMHARSSDVALFMNKHLERMSERADWLQQWNDFKPMERALLARLAEGKPLMDRDALDSYRETIGVPIPGAAVQQAINRLSRESVFSSKGKGVYEFESQSFKDWVIEYAAGRTSSAPIVLGRSMASLSPGMGAGG